MANIELKTKILNDKYTEYVYDSFDIQNREETQVSIPMKVGEEGRLFGTVTPAAIAKELILHGYEIDRRNITIEEPIKTLGVFTVKVKLHQEVTSPLKVWVISEE